MTETTVHTRLENGIELACATLPQRRAVALEFRVLAGAVHEPEDRLGLARIVDETIAKGTAVHDARGLSDAFDEIGASRGSWAERECTRFVCLVLPEYVGRAIELHAEFLRTPTFPPEFCQVAIELGRQELAALEDDPQALADKRIGQQAYGPVLGRHPAGERETLDRIGRDDVLAFWRGAFRAGRMQVSVAGPIEAGSAADLLGRPFDGWGAPEPAGRETTPVQFDARRTHHAKDLEQVQIAVAVCGLPKTHPRSPVERVVLGILSGGMSSRLFTEVREKQGLVYWVSAWPEYSRGAGMIFVGASSRLEHCDRTYATILRELGRLTVDIAQEELERTVTQIEVQTIIRGDRTRARCAELSDDLFYRGELVPVEQKLARIRAVTLDDIHQYQTEHPWGSLSVVTLGPKEIGPG